MRNCEADECYLASEATQKGGAAVQNALVHSVSKLPALTELRRCSRPEVESYIDYLESSEKPDNNVEHAVADALRRGRAILRVAKLASLDALGTLPTFWQWIGEGEKVRWATACVDRPRFLVQEALTYLQQGLPPDDYHLTCVAHLMRRDEAGDQPQILLWRDPKPTESPYLLDGNHAAVTVYERRRISDDGTFQPRLYVLDTFDSLQVTPAEPV